MTITTKAYQILGLIRWTFRINCIKAKKHLYISLIRSLLMYCSQIWRPQLIRDITTLERVQCRATKYILNDYTSSYKSRLLQLNSLTLMYIYELNDLMFLIKSLNTPTENFDIKDFISFNTSSTRSGSHLKLCHPRALSTNHHHFYFNQIVRLWKHTPCMPAIDISLSSHVIKRNLTKY